MASRLRERTKIALSIPFAFKNWVAVYRNIFGQIPIDELDLRTGDVIRGRHDTQLWNHYNEIWNKHIYSQHFAIPKDGTVVDIGANVGLFAVYAAKSAKVVHAFEPEPGNFSLLKQNCQTQKNIVVHNEAVGAEDGQASLSVGRVSTGFSLYGGAGDTCAVAVRKLSSVFADYGIDYCDFLKLDCEGAEYAILLDSPPELFSKVGVIGMEYHDHLSTRTHVEIVNRLQKLDFQSTVYHVSGTYGMIAASRQAIRN